MFYIFLFGTLWKEELWYEFILTGPFQDKVALTATLVAFSAPVCGVGSSGLVALVTFSVPVCGVGSSG